MSVTSKYQKILAVRNTLNALLAEMEQEQAPSAKPKRKKRGGFEEYERALITGTRIRKPDHLRKTK